MVIPRPLNLHKPLAPPKTSLQRQTCPDVRTIDTTDRHIDQLVYELYGLTPDEIRIVEDTTDLRSARSAGRTVLSGELG